MFKLFKKSPQDYNKSEVVGETEELNEAIYRVNNWYVMTPRALFWHLIETKYSLTVNHQDLLTRHSIGCLV